MRYSKAAAILLWWCIAGQLCLAAAQSGSHTREEALRFISIADTVLKPAYGPLAEQIVNEYNLVEREGIGIDLGSGPGHLIVELCKRTRRVQWINADINPHFFPFFSKAAQEAGVEHRVRAIFADAQALPFEDNYAEIIVSRGSFQFWENKRLAFSEIHRVLKPGGDAFIGRGFSENLPVEIAQNIRSRQGENGKGPQYNIARTAAELQEIMLALEINDYRIRIPKPLGSEGVNYGIWIEFHKPASQEHRLNNSETEGAENSYIRNRMYVKASDTITAGSTGKIQGTIVDSESKEPLPSVNVVIERTTLGAATDEEGYFLITDVPPGTYSLKASMVGYAPETKEKVRVFAGRTTTADFSLLTSAIAGEEVMVRAIRLRNVIEEPMLESPGLELSTTVVSKLEIRKQGAKNIIDAMEYVPSALVETRGRKVKQFFSVRGQRYPYPEYTVDGAWQREFHELPYFFSSPDIEHIEIVRSSAALLKGLSGLVGIINIIPRVYREPETSAETEYGTYNTYRLHLSHGAAKGKVSYAASLGQEHTNGPDEKNAGETMANFRGSLHWQPMANLSIRTNIFHLDGMRELRKAEPPADSKFQNTSEKFDPFRATLINLKAHYRPSKRTSTELLLHYTDRDHNFINAGTSPHTSSHEYDYEWGLNVIQSISLSGRNVLRVGGLYNHWIAPNGKRFFVGRRSDLETYSAVVVDEHRFGSMIVDAGLRWAQNHIKEYGAFNINGSSGAFRNVTPVIDEWEPSIINTSIGAAYYPSQHLSLHFNCASGYIRPRVGTLDVNMMEPKNERRVKLDIGIRPTLEGIGKLSVVGVFVQQRDAIVLSDQTVTTLDNRTMELYLNRDQYQLGVEFEVRSTLLYNTASFFINGMAMNSQAESEGGMKRNRELPQFNMGGGIFVSKSKLDLNIFWKYVSSYESTRFVASTSGPQQLGNFFVLNATAGWSFGERHHTRIYLEATNLTDKKFLTVVGYPDYGRRFNFGVRQTFK